MHKWENNFDKIFFLENIVLLFIGNTTKMFGKKSTMILSEYWWPVLFGRVTVALQMLKFEVLLLHVTVHHIFHPIPPHCVGLPLILFPSIFQPCLITLNCSSVCLQHSFSLPYLRSPHFSSPYNSFPGILLPSIFTLAVQWSCTAASTTSLLLGWLYSKTCWWICPYHNAN